MKTKKIIATIVALASFATMATSSLAAVTTTTTTTYDTAAGKVEVNTSVTGLTQEQQVTYLVEGKNDGQVTGSNIVYIDQKLAVKDKDGETYKADFSFKAKTGALPEGLKLTVKSNAASESTADFYAAPAADESANYTVTYSEAIVGNDDTTTATVAAKNGYEVTKITDAKGNELFTKEGAQNLSHELTYDQLPLVVETEAVVTTPVVEGGILSLTVADEEKVDGKDVVAKAAIIKVAGSPKEVGVVYKGVYYPALTTIGDTVDPDDGKAYVDASLYAVKLIIDKAVDGDPVIQRYYKMADSEYVILDN